MVPDLKTTVEAIGLWIESSTTIDHLRLCLNAVTHFIEHRFMADDEAMKEATRLKTIIHAKKALISGE